MKRFTIWKGLVIALILVAVYHDWYMHQLDDQFGSIVKAVLGITELMKKERGLTYQ